MEVICEKLMAVGTPIVWFKKFCFFNYQSLIIFIQI